MALFVEKEAPAATQTRPQQKPDNKPGSKPKEQPPYVVIVHNDDVNTFDHVILTLMKVFGYNKEKAVRLTLQVHCHGRAHVWSGMREHAELKAEQIVACGPSWIGDHRGAQPLSVTIEPLEG